MPRESFTEAERSRSQYSKPFADGRKQRIRLLLSYDHPGHRKRIATTAPVFGRDRAGELLDAVTEPTAADVQKLALPQHYSDAANALIPLVRRKLEAESLPSILHDAFTTKAILTARVGAHFGAVPSQRDPTAALAIPNVHAALADESRRAAARLSLCVIGDPPDEWDALSRKERAGLLLGRICRAMRARSS